MAPSDEGAVERSETGGARGALSFVRNYLSCTVRKSRTLLPSRLRRATFLPEEGFSRRGIRTNRLQHFLPPSDEGVARVSVTGGEMKFVQSRTTPPPHFVRHLP